MHAVQDKGWFQGLPSPAAATLVAGLVWVMVDNHVTGADIRWLAWGLTLFAGISMVTNLRYYSGKDINLKKSVPFIVIVLIALSISLVAIDPPIVLLLLLVAYGFSGYAIWAHRRMRRRPKAASAP
jgi:CDP-diacylglycerol--serine O-phosphatidyltransferase